MQINAKSFFLTYPRCAITAETFQLWLESTFTPTYLVIGSELHQDGTPHVHVCFTLDTALRTRDERVFDFHGHHPNIVRPRAIKKCIDYVKKDGNFIESGEPPAMKRKWSELQTATTSEEFFKTALEISPRDYYLNQERLEYMARKLFKPVVPTYVPQWVDFNIPQELSDWIDQRHEVCYRPQSLILYGASRTGKTEWARSLGPHVYFNGYFMLDLIRDDVEYAIFDDFEDWTTFKQYKQWLGAQKQFVCTDKYRKKVDLLWGKPCIILSNEYPAFRDQDWILLNCITVKLNKPLY
ncbi:replication associated protein [Lake Sarah-associated circular virus-2]|uniref:replication associated protein n=1 Tax=Lake Sarah-associated circular virus-2 TaxID=1685746 RepID=UPI0007779B9C|nr:replication associated protein [Lake Sarah-associated circular virus-2]ALE29576.1 replication associated protein [Lake Sarah-associated circular virus-2]